MEREQNYDGFSRSPVKETLQPIGPKTAPSYPLIQVYVYYGNPMPEKEPDDKKFVCLGKDNGYVFMPLDDLRERIVWTDGKVPDCYEKDRINTSGLTLWQLEGDIWPISPHNEALWEQWFVRGPVWGKPDDEMQYHRWTRRAINASNANTIIGSPKFARFWLPEKNAQITSHFFFEPLHEAFVSALKVGLGSLKENWESRPLNLDWSFVELGAGGTAADGQARVHWATHYLEFYKIWVSKAHYDALAEVHKATVGADKVAWPFPDGTKLNNMIKGTKAPRDVFNDSLNSHDTESSTNITRGKMETMSGTRAHFDNQGEVMGVPANEMYQMLLGSNAPLKPLSNGLWPAEWLHRSAFRFGGLEGDVSSPQSRRNLVLGTSESNTYMLLLENTIADCVARSDKPGQLITCVKYPQDWNLSKYTWLAPTLEYDFIFKHELIIKPGTPKEQATKHTAVVHTFSRRLTHSLEARASYYFLEALLG
ncbi:ABC transporter G family member 18 [Mycena sanguinolenta]|uniref:ABC transporter G family member 18 n=1 Tax=Mycena sanguinolenta TaxID=230812 RepID=A0A8H7DK79_9AGAR|nr:ABC transporter G family member 18 [Mycena sanguinolenta]